MCLVSCIKDDWLIYSLRIVKGTLKYIFLVTSLVLTGCTSGIKYGVKQLDPCSGTILDSLGKYKFEVDLKKQIENAENRGFFVEGRSGANQLVINRNISSAMELGLSDIYFNTLRWKLSKEKNKQADPWDESNPTSRKFICPKPWEYRVINHTYREKVGGTYRESTKPIRCFYLPGVQMGEYLDPSNSNNYELICNYDENHAMRRNARAPYIMLSSNVAEDYEATKRSSMVELDHLIRDDTYFIELPQSLHTLKTSLLDPLNYQPNTPNRNFMNSGIYWRLRQEWVHVNRLLNDNQRNEFLRTCSCGIDFPQPGNGVVREYHEHTGDYQTLYGATMLPMNLT